jgi:hypothetical protein
MALIAEKFINPLTAQKREMGARDRHTALCLRLRGQFHLWLAFLALITSPLLPP